MPHSASRDLAPLPQSMPAIRWRALLGALCVAGWALVAAPAALAAPPAAGKTGEIRIGAIVPESWPNAAQGQEIRNGMMLALKTWPGYPVPTLEVKDSRCDPQRSVMAAQALLEAKVDIVLGGWCEVGLVPGYLKGAGVPYVSANAERHVAAEGSAQFGRVNAGVAEGIATRLRAETGLRVTANSVCWIDFEPRVSDKYDAALCPTLTMDRTLWDEAAATYSAAFQKPFSFSAARGYAAMQVALAYVTRLRAGAKPATAWAEAQAINTVLGKLPTRESATPDTAMQLVLNPKMAKLPPREAQAFDQMVKAKGCGCKTCSGLTPWSDAPFVVASPAGSSCAQVVLTSAR